MCFVPFLTRRCASSCSARCRPCCCPACSPVGGVPSLLCPSGGAGMLAAAPWPTDRCSSGVSVQGTGLGSGAMGSAQRGLSLCWANFTSSLLPTDVALQAGCLATLFPALCNASHCYSNPRTSIPQRLPQLSSGRTGGRTAVRTGVCAEAAPGALAQLPLLCLLCVPLFDDKGEPE